MKSSQEIMETAVTIATISDKVAHFFAESLGNPKAWKDHRGQLIKGQEAAFGAVMSQAARFKLSDAQAKVINNAPPAHVQGMLIKLGTNADRPYNLVEIKGTQEQLDTFLTANETLISLMDDLGGYYQRLAGIGNCGAYLLAGRNPLAGYPACIAVTATAQGAATTSAPTKKEQFLAFLSEGV